MKEAQEVAKNTLYKSRTLRVLRVLQKRADAWDREAGGVNNKCIEIPGSAGVV